MLTIDLCSSGDYDEDGGGGGGAAKMANALQDGGVDKVEFQFLYSLLDGKLMECKIHLRKKSFEYLSLDELINHSISIRKRRYVDVAAF